MHITTEKQYSVQYPDQYNGLSARTQTGIVRRYEINPELFYLSCDKNEPIEGSQFITAHVASIANDLIVLAPSIDDPNPILAANDANTRLIPDEAGCLFVALLAVCSIGSIIFELLMS